LAEELVSKFQFENIFAVTIV